MKALKTLKTRLKRIQQAQAAIVTEAGHVPACYRERYNILTKQAKEFKQAIDQWEKWKEEGWFNNG